MSLLRIVALVLFSTGFFLGGCGSGGGGNSAASHSAELHLSMEGSIPADKAISGVGITLTLPTGVRVATASDGEVAAGTVVASGVTAGSAGVVPVYTPASSTARGTISFALASSAADGFGVGEFVAIKFTYTGTVPLQTDFSVTGFSPVDLSGAPLPTGADGLQTAVAVVAN